MCPKQELGLRAARGAGPRPSGMRHERRSIANMRRRRVVPAFTPAAAGAAEWSRVPRKSERLDADPSVGVGSRGGRRGDGPGTDRAGAPVGALAASDRGGGVPDGSAERGTNQGERLRGYDPAVQGAGSRLEPLRGAAREVPWSGYIAGGRSAKPRFCRTEVESGAPHGPSLQAGSIEVR